MSIGVGNEQTPGTQRDVWKQITEPRAVLSSGQGCISSACSRTQMHRLWCSASRSRRKVHLTAWAWLSAPLSCRQDEENRSCSQPVGGSAGERAPRNGYPPLRPSLRDSLRSPPWLLPASCLTSVFGFLCSCRLIRGIGVASSGVAAV